MGLLDWLLRKLHIRKQEKQIDIVEKTEETNRFERRLIPDKCKFEKIRKQNVERRKATMGDGLKSRYFKPRPAYEKRLFDLRKKPEKETE